jgi:hypothetical protein
MAVEVLLMKGKRPGYEQIYSRNFTNTYSRYSVKLMYYKKLMKIKDNFQI